MWSCSALARTAAPGQMAPAVAVETRHDSGLLGSRTAQGEANVAGLPSPAVYVHGAGQQLEPGYLKRVLDSILLGRSDDPGTELAYFADILHVPRQPPAWIESQATAAAEAVAGPEATTRVFTANLATVSARAVVRVPRKSWRGGESAKGERNGNPAGVLHRFSRVCKNANTKAAADPFRNLLT